ncbi:MAG: helix-turn-helix domain-containing protein [Clostridia bacterium]|nr:helix-turn-helix domain-containing protein [Clostridia bacterium]
MYKVHYVNNNTDICMPENPPENLPHVIEVGHSFPPPGYESKKLCRDTYVIHYVISGKGKYYGQTVEGPCAFLETPENIHYYCIDDLPDTPQWEQYWIMFSGPGIKDWLSDAGFPEEPSCFPCPYIHQAYDILRDLQTPSGYVNQNDHYYMMAGLCQLFSLHSATKQSEQKHSNYTTYVRTICNYIHENYANITCEDELADLVHLSTRYMHKIFKEETGTSPIRYLNTYRVRCAKILLTEHDLPIHVIAEMLGFSNPNYFCYVFQKHCDGISPLAYKKKHRLN